MFAAPLPVSLLFLTGGFVPILIFPPLVFQVFAIGFIFALVPFMPVASFTPLISLVAIVIAIVRPDRDRCHQCKT